MGQFVGKEVAGKVHPGGEYHADHQAVSSACHLTTEQHQPAQQPEQQDRLDRIHNVTSIPAGGPEQHPPTRK